MRRSEFFQLTQILILGLIVVTVFLFRRKNQRKSQFGVTEAELWAQKKNSESATTKPPSPTGAQAKAAESPKIALGSAFPAWTQHTPAQEILGVRPDASVEVVEAAYKALFKKYHPDRYNTWAPEYQQKAHETIVQLQRARSEFEAKVKSRHKS